MLFSSVADSDAILATLSQLAQDVRTLVLYLMFNVFVFSLPIQVV